ncbi:IclR family transcriptional regulator [Celeribacter persicus]|uniref:IclR family transcriptional regulator n=1 Tax=Celeribacter persicus TaxID=1651082 RepID=A0A2T5HUQ3_9RHOB|nr:helix-turn-helix domain-containing protein [Celeribacter persicus]PTQ75296.1 IclR family transcriptional regulator [Celeribacter persicus]
MAEVSSFIKGLDILRQLAPEPEGKTAAEIGETLGIPRTTAIRFLNTLCRHNYATKQGSAYFLGPAALTISLNYMQRSDLVRSATEACQIAARDMAMPISFFIAGEDGVVMLARANETAGNLYDLSVGSKLNLASSAAGVAVLMERHRDLSPAGIAERYGDPRLESKIAAARDQGYAVSQDEVTVGYTALALPVRSDNRRGLGAFHAVYRTLPAGDPDPSRDDILAALQRARDLFLAL